MKVYDLPIFYFPKLSHPDPTVNRRSGFLPPLFSDSKNLELNPYWGAYNISKLGLEALINTWKKEIDLTNIKAHIFIPDDMDTKLRSSFMPGEKNKNLKQPDEIASKLIKLIRKI